MKPTFPLAMLLVWLLGNVCVANHVLIVVGPDSHGPGSHEPIAGARLLAHSIENLQEPPGHTAEVVDEWPSRKQQDQAGTIVFLGDTFPPNRFEGAARNLADLHRMMNRG